MRPFVALAIAVATMLPLAAQPAKVLTFDHKVAVKSTVPSLAGQTVNLYVRERVSASTKVDAIGADRVVLFVHGAGTPAEVAFDVPHSDYSWMAYLANAGFDVFAMDTTGYGRSVRPAEMNDPCNLSKEQQAQFVPALIPAVCDAKYPGQLTNLGSDWNDIAAVVDHIRALRKVEKVSLVAWSLGGPRAGGYAAQHPEKVQRLVLLAPAYNRDRRRGAARAAERRRRVQHAVAAGVRCELGPAARVSEPVRSRGAGGGVEGHDRVGSGRREMGERRAARAVHDHVGMERLDDRRHEDSDALHRGGTRSAGSRGARARRPTTTSVRPTRS